MSFFRKQLGDIRRYAVLGSSGLLPALSQCSLPFPSGLQKPTVLSSLTYFILVPFTPEDYFSKVVFTLKLCISAPMHKVWVS